MNPPGSRPGIRNFATIPTINPNMIHPITLMIHSSFFWQRNSSLKPPRCIVRRLHIWTHAGKHSQLHCCTKVIMSGVNGNVIMSGCRDDNPDDERREAARDNTKSVSRGTDGGGGRDGDRSQRAAMLPDQSWGNQARGEGSGAWESGSRV